MSSCAFYKSIEAHRKRVGASQKAVAEIIEVCEMSAANKLNGRTDFTLPEVAKLAERWGLSIDELVGL